MSALVKLALVISVIAICAFFGGWKGLIGFLSGFFTVCYLVAEGA